MNYLDIIILVFAGLLVIHGLRKGFIIGLASLVALVLGVYAAVHFSGYISSYLLEQFHPGKGWLPVLSFAITFLVVVIVVILIAKAIEKLLDLAGMGLLNHLLGGLLGLAEGLLILSVVFFIIHGFDPGEKMIKPESKQHSLLYRPVETIFPGVMKIFGGEFRLPSILNSPEKKPEKGSGIQKI